MMKRVFTDSRVPGMEIHNDGTVTFEVYVREGAVLEHYDTFVTYEGDGTQITESYANARAKDYFDRIEEERYPIMEENELSTNETPGEDDLCDTDPDEGRQAPRKPSWDEVLDMMLDAKKHPEGSKARETRMSQANKMRQQLESLPHSLVDGMLD